MNDFPKTVLTTFASIGILSKLLLTVFTSSKDGSIGPASASIWGNLIIIFSLISYLSIEAEALNDFLYPIYLIVLVLLWDTAVSYKYFERINKKEIPSLYYSWNTLLNLMLFAFVVLLIFAMFQTGNHTGNQTTPLLYIIGFFSLFIMGIQQTILDNFMVDTDVV
jgi:hypothetical protein